MEQLIQLTVHANKTTKVIGDLFGIFIEDLNHALDGGLYAEMVQNRSFEYSAQDVPHYHALTAWEKIERGQSIVKLHVESSRPLHPANPHYLVLDAARTGFGGVKNIGYNTGMHIRKGECYRFSCFYCLCVRKTADIRVRLESADGKICYAEQSFRAESSEWQSVELMLTADADDRSAHLVIGCTEPVSIALDMISLFPEDTFCGRKNGLRKDLAQMLADMKPKFLRFPGGCLVHCGSLNPDDRESMYRWKKTLGPVEERPVWRNIWSHNQTLGLGFYEYFLLCEDIGAQPLPVIPGGWDPHTLRATPMEDMQEWIDEALDLIEFANGAADTPWGHIRAQMGHPEPFGMKYLAIGNEEVGDAFFERYEIMHRAVQERYPDIQLIASAGPGNGGKTFEQGWNQARVLGASFVDEHFYQSPFWFIANAHRYETYPPDGPKAFLGEYASRGDTWWNALTEGAFMLGMEKAPGLGLACYAPLFCNADYVNWTPDMIWFNNHQAYGTPSYHVQKLMMVHQGDEEVAMTSSGGEVVKAIKSDVRGEIGFVSKDTDISIENFCLLNLETGEEIHRSEIHLTPEHTELKIADVNWTSFRISFDAIRNSACDEAHYLGSKSLVLELGRKDPDNMIRWVIDGWMGLSSLVQIRSGEFGELTLSPIDQKKGTVQRCSLEVYGDTLTPSFDGEIYPCGMICQPDIEPLYTAASLDGATGDLIIKAINLLDKQVQADLILEAYTPASLEIYEMSGFAPDDVNTFDHPFKVSPRSYCAAAKDHMRWNFQPYSLTILRFRRT